MRQYLKKHIEYIVITVAVISAMIFQYLRISSVDIAFLYETEVSSSLVYLMVILIIPIIVLFFVFLPLLLVLEITYQFNVPKSFEIKISKAVYSIRPVAAKHILRTKYISVMRC